VRGSMQRAVAVLFVAGIEPLRVFGGSSGSKSVFVFGELMPYSGASAFEGAQVTNGCLPAKMLINQSGGILGHQVTCEETDTRGDAVDAVPAANKMVATTSNLIAVLAAPRRRSPSLPRSPADMAGPLRTDTGHGRPAPRSGCSWWPPSCSRPGRRPRHRHACRSPRR